MTAAGREERAYVRAAQDGSVAELEALFHRHWPRLYRTAYLIVHDRRSAEEVAQEAFLAAVRTLDRFGRDRPFGPWLYRTVATRSVDGARGRATRRGPARQSLLEVTDPLGWEQPVVDPLADEGDAAFAAGLGLISPEQRAGLVLRYLLDVEPGEIADILDLPRSVANARLRSAREFLEGRLGAAATARAEDMRAYLQGFPVPDEELAEERAWDVVRAAYATREPTERSFRMPLVPLAALVLVAACVAVGVSPAGGEIWRFVQDEVGRDPAVEPAASAPELPALAGDGSLLVAAGGTIHVVEGGGASRALGSYDGAAWSPTGALVAAWGPNRLEAVDPSGSAGVQWSLERAGLTSVRWAAGGFRLGYVVDGALHVVEGNGQNDRELATGVAPVAPAWRPTDEDVLAFADARGRIATMNAETERVLWRTGRGPAVAAMEWSTDGQLLGVLDEQRLRVMLGPRRVFRTIQLPEGAAPGELLSQPGGRDFAYTLSTGGETSVYLLDSRRGTSRLLFAGAGELGGLAFSPDGAVLLVGWPAARQWLFLPVRGGGPVRAVPEAGALFGSGEGDFPAVTGWCCPRPAG